MIVTFEAITGAQEKIYPLEAIKFTAPQKVLVTRTLPTSEEDESLSTASPEVDSIQGFGWVVGNLEEGNREAAEMFNQPIERSGKEVAGKLS